MSDRELPKKTLRCLKCRRRIFGVTLLEVKLQGHDVRLFLIRCSKGDYRAAATEARVNHALAEALFDYLKRPPPSWRGSR